MSPEIHRGRARAISIDGIRHKQPPDVSGAKIAVIGLDPDGFSLAKRAAQRGFNTIAFDADEVKVAQLEAYDAKSAPGLSITSDPALLQDAVFILITVAGAGGSYAALEEIQRAAAIAGARLHEGALVIVESVVFPGVCEHVILPVLERSSGLTRPSQEHGNSGFFFAHAPAGNANSPRIVGASNKESLSRASALYRALGAEVHAVRSIKDAEAVRMVEDSLHDVSLALAGEFSILFDRIGIDIASVMKAVRPGLDPTYFSGIGQRRSSPSPYYLARSGHEHQIDQQFLSTARRIVEYMPLYAINTLTEILRERKIALKDATVALLGLSDTGDEQGVGFELLRTLEKKAGTVRAYDPLVARGAPDLKQTLEGAHAAIIASDVPVFRNLSPMQFEELGVLVVIDARNCLNKEAFENSSVAYRGIGRG